MQGLDNFVLSAWQVDVPAVSALGLDRLVGASEEDNHVGLLGQRDSLCEQLRGCRVGRITGLQRPQWSSFAPTHAVTPVSRCVCDLDAFLCRSSAYSFKRGNLVQSLHSGSDTARCCRQDGILTYDRYLLHILGNRKRVLFVLEKDDRFAGDFKCGFLTLRLRSHDGVGNIFRNRFYGKTQTEYFTDLGIHDGLIKGTVPDGIDKGLAEVIVACHLDAQASKCRTHSAVRASPVRYGHSLETPFATKYFIEKMCVFRAVISVDLVICRHHAHCAAFLDCRLEWLEIYLTHRTFVSDDIDASTVGLLVVEGEMLQADSRSFILCALGVFYREAGGQYRVFTEILICTSSDREPLDVDGRSEDDVLASQTAFPAHRRSVPVSKFS